MRADQITITVDQRQRLLGGGVSAYRPQDLAHWTGLKLTQFRMPEAISDRHVVGLHVKAQCRIDEAGLRASMRLAPSLVYSEDDNRGRLHEEPLGASLSCRVCNSAIRTTDPWEWREETTVFPRTD